MLRRTVRSTTSTKRWTPTGSGTRSARSTPPLLITDPEGEQLWPGQSQQLFDRLNGDKQLAHFMEADGAGRHCEPLAPARRDARVFDWLDRYLS